MEINVFFAMGKIRTMKKILKWAGIIISIPVILFIILFILLYIPPIQNFLVGKATAYASKTTGMKIGIERITLSFPLNLVAKGMEVVSEKDTLLSVDHFQVNIQLLPLFKKQVEIDGIELEGARVNSSTLLKGMRVKGSVGEFFISSHGVDLATQQAILDKVNLKNSDLYLCLNDTAEAPADTTSNPLNWKFTLEKLNLENVTFSMDMPADSISMSAILKEASLQDGWIDLSTQSYRVDKVGIENGVVRYDSGKGKPIDGFDPSHILLRDVQLRMDSLQYEGKKMGAAIRKFSMRERSGLEVVSLTGDMHTDEKAIYVPKLVLETQHSYINLSMQADWNAIEELNEGNISCNLAADIGKQDVLLFTGKLPDRFKQEYPFRPLVIRAEAAGNMKMFDLHELRAELPGAFTISAQGKGENLLDSLSRSVQVDIKAETHKLDFILAMLDTAARSHITIPSSMWLEGKAQMKGPDYKADLLFRENKGKIGFSGEYNQMTQDYQAELSIDSLQLKDFLPQDSLEALTATFSAKGKGFDFFSPKTSLKAGAEIRKFNYGPYDLSGIKLEALLDQSVGRVTLDSNNPLLALKARVDALLKQHDLEANISVDASRINLYGLHLTEQPFETSLRFDLQAQTDLKKEVRLDGSVSDLKLITSKQVFAPKDLIFGAETTADSTLFDLQAGDLRMLFRGGNDLSALINESSLFSKELMEQIAVKRIDQNKLKELLPGVSLLVTAGKDNPVSNYLSMSNLGFSKFYLDLDASQQAGLTGDAYLYSLRTDSLQLDTIRFDIDQDTTGVKFKGKIINGPQNRQFVFTATAEGAIHENDAELLLKYMNAKGETGILLGIRAVLEEKGLAFHLFPDQPILVFRPFHLNKDNYIFWGDNKRITADVELLDDKGTGIRLYSLPDANALQDIALELRQIEIGEFTNVIPYMPDIKGVLSAEAHYTQTETTTQLAADLKIDGFAYEQDTLGNISLGAVYLPGEGGDHHINAYLSHNEQEVLTAQGVYHTSGANSLDAEVSLQHFPLDIANVFIPEHFVELSGDLDGELKVKGEPSKPDINGQLKLDSVSVYIAQAGARFRFDEEPIPIRSSKMIFDQFNIYTAGKNPFTVNGNVDFSDFSRMRADLKLDAENYELLNAPRRKESLVYGKVFVDLHSTVQGPLDALVMRGNIILQGNTDVTYVLKDSPLTVQDRLSGLVTFVNFNDTTQVIKQEAPSISLGGLDMLMTIQIDPAVQLKVDLSADQESRIELEGGGDLSLQYTPQGDLMLSGRYTLTSGLLKYSLSFISKTFSIQNGSYVEWTGNVMDPTLNITAIERNRTSVAMDNQAARMVNFDVSISIKNQLKDLALVFDLAAPEDAAVQNQLSAMTLEERGKLAVTMLATGMYLVEGNKSGSGFDVNNAMNSFLQSQITNVLGSALKTVDISLGVETSDGIGEDGSGKRTDYSFRFAKRFWNNRLNVIVGGRLFSTGDNTQNNQPFIDNVTLEYRLDNTGTRYITLFHDKNYESILEGEITETGAGLMLRKKMSHMRELFIFKRKKKNLTTKSDGTENKKK